MPFNEATESTSANKEANSIESVSEQEMSTEQKKEEKTKDPMDAASTHKSRAQTRSPPGPRPPRSFSTPHRRIRSSSDNKTPPHGKKNALKELATPKLMDIRQVFKRKTLASSPVDEVDNNTKLHKQDGQFVT